MKKLVSLAVAFVLVLSLFGCGGGSPAESPDKSSAGANDSETTTSSGSAKDSVEEPENEESYEITYSSARAYTNSIGTTYAQVIVEIENTGSTDLYFSSGSYDLEDKDGGLVASSTFVTTYPEVISPGEKAYMYEENMFDEAFEGELTVLPRPDSKKATVKNIRYAVTDVKISEDKYGFLKATGRVENTSSESESMVYIAFILKNEANEPIGQMFTIIMEDLNPGDKIGFEASGVSLPDDITADSVASYDVFAYPSQFQF